MKRKRMGIHTHARATEKNGIKCKASDRQKTRDDFISKKDTKRMENIKEILVNMSARKTSWRWGEERGRNQSRLKQWTDQRTENEMWTENKKKWTNTISQKCNIQIMPSARCNKIFSLLLSTGMFLFIIRLGSWSVCICKTSVTQQILYVQERTGVNDVHTNFRGSCELQTSAKSVHVCARICTLAEHLDVCTCPCMQTYICNCWPHIHHRLNFTYSTVRIAY